MNDQFEIEQFISRQFQSAAKLMNQMADESPTAIADVAQLMIDCLLNGGKILVCGNGGSAADAQHLAAELSGKYRRERRPLPAIALTTDTSVLTATANDFGFSQVFSRQVEALTKPGDIVVGISTSGRSGNVIAAIQSANFLGAHTVALTGSDITGLGGLASHVITAPSTDTPRIQEAHGVIIHILCDLVEQALSDEGRRTTNGE